jgi:hypothetical protein
MSANKREWPDAVYEFRTCSVHGLVKFRLRKETKSSYICTKCASERVSRIQKGDARKLKIAAGGKCIRCGYDRCLDALHFHHRDPKDKEFQLSRCRHYTYERKLLETKKCDLVCANCHAEIEAERKENKLAND